MPRTTGLRGTHLPRPRDQLVRVPRPVDGHGGPQTLSESGWIALGEVASTPRVNVDGVTAPLPALPVDGVR